MLEALEDTEDNRTVKREENATADGSITFKGDVEKMLENLEAENNRVAAEEAVYDEPEENYDGGHFRYGEDNGAVKSALGPGYVLGANPEEDPRSFE